MFFFFPIIFSKNQKNIIETPPHKKKGEKIAGKKHCSSIIFSKKIHKVKIIINHPK
jgi:hypothetical protein